MRTNRFIRQLAIVLMLLVAREGLAATFDDPGGGTYDYRAYNNWGGANPSQTNYFKTIKDFSFTGKDNAYCWEYEFCSVINPAYPSGNDVSGDVKIQTSDNKWHKIAEWHKRTNSGNIEYFNITDETWGKVQLLSDQNLLSTSGNIRMRITPNERSFADGVKRFRVHFTCSSYSSGAIDPLRLTEIYFEKEMNTALGDKLPIPKVNVEFGDDKTLTFTVDSVIDNRENSNYIRQSIYNQRWSLTEPGYYVYSHSTLYIPHFEVTNEYDGMIDVRGHAYAYRTSAYFYPIDIYVTRQAEIDWEGKADYKLTVSTPAERFILDPFTRPTAVNVMFDKWAHKNTITWTRNEKATGYNSSHYKLTRNCRFDGKWFVIRFEDDQPATDYKVITELDGPSTELAVEDTDIEYDKKYHYRVIFLPYMLVDKYRTQLASGMLESQGNMLVNFWLEQTVSTELEMPIALRQDMTYKDAVRLMWDYCVEPSGQNWTIEYSPVGKNAWRVLDNSLMVDPNASEALFDADGSPCDFFDYRVKTSYMDRDFYSNVISGHLPAASYISEVNASTGTEERTVIVKWKVARPDINNDIYYHVLRRAVGTEEWTLLTDAVHGRESEYTYIDDRPLAGSYYEYTVEAYGSACPEQVDQIVKIDELTTPGFSQARGTITGHISFGTGTAVAGARVNLIKSSADESSDQPQFLSRYIEGEGKGLQWTADSAKYVKTLNGSRPLTLQLWAKPQPAGTDGTMALLRLAGALEIGVKGNGSESHLYAVDNSDGGVAVKEFPDLLFDPMDFTHVAAVYQGRKWTFYVGTDTLLTASMTTEAADWNAIAASSGTNAGMPTLALAGSNRIGGVYKGYVDDVRLWTRALTKEEVDNNYTRIQGGTEDGLILYWPLDEGINVKRYAFDVSRQDGIYQLNHPTVGVNAQPSAIVPQRLSLYGVTDAEGDYIIKGIPFQQGGTNYKLAPELGIHEFSPATRSMFVSPTSLTANNIDFEDVSSFPMEGYVYYAGTNIPAEGIQLYVDGNLQSEDGKIVRTDDNGYYRVAVPIGEHFVEAKLDGHTMVSGGRFPTEGRFNFNRAMTCDFADSTLVNLVGRVSGGLRNDTLAVGFGASKNNIGQATITLKLNNESFLLNTDPTQSRTWDSDTTSIQSTAQTGIGSDAKYITIQTDPLTGEFSAMLPPLKYTTKSIAIPQNKDDIEFSSLPEIDLTSVRKEMTDSLKQATEDGDSVWNYYKYNTKMVKTHFAQPEVALWQEKGDGAFGEQTLKDYAVSSTETIDITDIWTRQDDGTVKYTYNFPVYARKKKYKFGLFGYEAYTNYDTGTAVTDTIPMDGQVLTIANEMSDEQSVVARVIDPTITNLKAGDIYQLKRNQVRLDSLGRNEVTFTTGVPNITAPYTRQFSVTYERNKRTYTGPSLNGIVLGELTNGNNFVTDGPDHVDMVLRDPPGAKSKTTWKKGTSYTRIHNKTRGFYTYTDVDAEVIWGENLKTAVGLGVAIVSSSEATTVMNFGNKTTSAFEWKNDSLFVYTTAENISTSSGTKYVGASGDVFIGKSHNYIIGTCRKLGFSREADGIKLGLKDAMSINDSIKTDFMYSTLEIEETMLPKIKDTRNKLLEYADSTSAIAYTNTSDKDVYLTWLKPDDSRYGEEDTYVWKPNINGKTQDMVLHYNESMRLWKQRLAENEQDKIEAFQNAGYFKENRSFDGGTSYSYSERRDTTLTSTTSTNIKTGLTYSWKTCLCFFSGVSVGTNLNFDSEVDYAENEVKGDSLDNVNTYVEYDYELNDGNTGTDFTVDIYRSPRGWSDIFLLRAGQSYNPYEKMEYAKYYEPEKQHVISYGTEQMEQPVIMVSPDGEVAAKSATLTDIPAGGTGQFTLHLTNQSSTNQTIPILYNIMVQEMANQQGLEILMDGLPANGRSIFVPQGETIKKVITVRQTDQSVLDYENIEIWLMSQYQPVEINDKCMLNVHFKPSSSAIDLVIAEPVLNTDNKTGELDLKLTNFDRQFKNLKNVGVQYRFAGNTQWTDLHTWVTDKADSTSASFSLLPSTGDLPLKVDMSSNLSYPEGQYEFRGFTTTPYGTDLVQIYSDVITVTKDMTRPRNLFTPSPANGILGYGDQLAIEFNEDIVPGYVDPKNVIVTAKLNQQTVDHEVSLKLIPFGDIPRTANPVFLKGDFTMDFWLCWHDSGTILRQGAGTDKFSLSIDEAGHLVVSIAGTKVISQAVLPKDEWTYFALSYEASTMTFDILAQYGTTNVDLFQNEPVSEQAAQAVNYSDDNYLYLGHIDADIHDLSLYNICLDVNEAAATKYQSKDNYVYGLANYWPMNEGHGTTVSDSRHTHDFILTFSSWQVQNLNYALRIDTPEGAQADITSLGTGRGDSYAIELWYKSSIGSTEVVFENATPTVVGDMLPQNKKLRLSFDEQHNLTLAYGTKQQTVASADDFPNLDFGWHHYALNVVRGQAASFYLDGQRTAVIAEADVPSLEGSALIVARDCHRSFVDELRIWKASLSEGRLLNNIYNAIDTADVYSRGLVAYYPFEKTGTVNGVTTKVETYEDMSASSQLTGTIAEMTCPVSDITDDAPPVKNAPEETRLIASPVASERKVVINLTGAGISPRDIEGTTLNVTVDQVHDLHGNTSLPIRWTAYVQQNTLKWMKDSVNVIKKYGDDCTFDVNIENKGGNTEYYTLYNLPQWLSVEGSSAEEVSPLKTKVLRFHVSPLAAVGNYDVTIGLQGNNGILEPLRIVMKVSGEKPQWAVDPTLYDHHMTIVGQVYNNGILMENEESMVAAFIDGECRGVASPAKTRGTAYVMMNIYGKTMDHQKDVSFRIWDASQGVAYTDALLSVDGEPTDVTFCQDQLIGNYNSPAIWTKTDNVEQLIPIHANWNWIAFGVEPQSKYLDHIFSDYSDWTLLIKNRIAYSDYNGAEWRGTLIPAVNDMYKLKVDRLPTTKTTLNSQLSVKGHQPKASEIPVTLKSGWNWIAYTPLTTMTIAKALSAANPQHGDIVKSQTAMAIYGSYGWEGNLQALEEGHGYMYYSSDAGEKSFCYPDGKAALALARAATPWRAPEPTSIFTPVDLGLYPNNMTMTIRLISADGSDVDTCEVAAFIGDECRGATRANNNGLYYLVISGEGAGQPMTLRTCLNEQIVNIDDTQVFISDDNIGTSWEPYVIDLSDLPNGITTASGYAMDDDTEWYTLQGIKLGRRPTQPGVYIHHGKKVTIRKNVTTRKTLTPATGKE